MIKKQSPFRGFGAFPTETLITVTGTTLSNLFGRQGSQYVQTYPTYTTQQYQQTQAQPCGIFSRQNYQTGQCEMSTGVLIAGGLIFAMLIAGMGGRR